MTEVPYTPTENAMSRYGELITDPDLRAALLRRDVDAVMKIGAALLEKHPAPLPSLIGVKRRTEQDEQSSQIAVMISTLTTTQGFERALISNVQRARSRG